MLVVFGSLTACSTSAQQPTTSQTPAPTQRNLPVQYDPTQDPAMNQPQAPQKDQPVIKPAAKDAPVMVFRKTRCFGTCPAYTATVYADGRVAYDGQDFVNLKGKHELRLPTAVINQALQRANKLHFSQLQNQYLSGVSDLPSTYLTLTLADGTPKTVQTELTNNTPAELKELLAYLTEQFSKIAGNETKK
ncbi:DUF6438 domain-containing protein [Hymenobacter aerilatus]|uniref:DUF6438 domain-containing protein n=1 Tax=Hymenobacter aerilatus TaxID=2932251 RepID=A0A8T9SW21_9BACT|nr:DUF6438 domain-containing protein [Hymenobacter aerilatus]UOR05937.1 DUF6438 domain-containing protein [Hymenobacter aerilatus]